MERLPFAVPGRDGPWLLLTGEAERGPGPIAGELGRPCVGVIGRA